MTTNAHTIHYHRPRCCRRHRRRRPCLLLLLLLLRRRRRRRRRLLLRRVRTKRDGGVHGRQRRTRSCATAGHGVRHGRVRELARCHVPLLLQILPPSRFTAPASPTWSLHGHIRAV